jgi:hypothetical protein
VQSKGRKRPDFQALIDAAPAVSPEQRQRQLVSLAYGNLKLEDDRVTRPAIERAVATLSRLPTK